MKVEVQTQFNPEKIDNLYVMLTEGSEAPLNLPESLNTLLRDMIETSGFSGRSEQMVSLISDEPRKLTLVGLGKAEKLDHKVARAGFFQIAHHAQKNVDEEIAVVFPYRIGEMTDAEMTVWAADQLSHADYRYDRYLSEDDDENERIEINATLIAPESIDRKTGRKLSDESQKIADAVRTAKDLANGPGNFITPEYLAQRAEELAKEYGFSCTVYDKKAIEKMKMGGLLAVNQGSDREPRFIVMEHRPRKAGRTICLVGKGITFDSGGISIKPSERMEEMKFDMSGGAAVIGMMQAVAALGIRHNVIGLVPATENLPSGRAYKPGDIIRTMSGKTVEIVNTDAEGRMILCDALHYSARYEPDHLIDFATLTGACVIALGTEASGLFSNDDELARKLIDAGGQVGERLWRMPEWDDYLECIRSEWADVKNSGGRSGGAITAAVFLKQFVECDSWAHVDIAGTAWADNKTARERKGATGAGVRAAIRFLQSL